MHINCRVALQRGRGLFFAFLIGITLLATDFFAIDYLSAQAAAGAAAESIRDPRWSQYTRDRDMLVSNDIRAIWVDEHSLWFGGEGGFSFYNGVWKTHTSVIGLNGLPLDDSSLISRQPLGQIQAFTRDVERDILWAGSSEGLLLRWDGEVWSVAAELKSSIYALGILGDGTLWIGTDDGLYQYNVEAKSEMLIDVVGRQPVYSFLIDAHGAWIGTSTGLWRYRNDRWTQIGSSEPNLALGVYAMVLSEDGALVVGTPYGIGWQTGNHGRWKWFETFDAFNEPVLIQTLAFDQNDTLWAGSDGAGVFSLRLDIEGTEQTYGYTGDLNLTTSFVRQIVVDRDNSIWMATPAGVFRYQAYRWFNDTQGSLEDVSNYINDLLVTREGVLWAVTGGAGVRRKQGVQGHDQIFAEADGAPQVGFALVQDTRGAIWVGGPDGLFRYAQGRWDVPIAPDILPDREVTSLAVDDLDLWIGTTRGLAHLSIATGELIVVTSLGNVSVEDMTFDNLGRIWIGTYDHGVWVRELDGRWRQFVYNSEDPGSLPGNRVLTHSLAADSRLAGGMWAIVDNRELVHWDGSVWERASNTWPSPTNLLWTIYTDPVDGSLWVGSEAGVTHYDGLTWHTFGANDGLQSAVVYAVARTPDGAYWFGGSMGLTYFLPDRTAPWVILGMPNGEYARNAAGQPVLNVGQEALIPYEAGDLQSSAGQLLVMQRVAGPKFTTPWISIDDNYIRHRFDEPGEYNFELVVRDESFNYSEIATLLVDVIEPPALIRLPILGAVDVGVFRLLALLGAMIVLGSSYMVGVILSNRRRALEALAREFNPYISGEPVRQYDMFFGRRNLLQRIIDTLHSNSIMIHGERRIGKTSLLLNLMTALREVNDPDYWFMPVYIDLEGTPQELFFQLLTEEIILHVDTLKDASDEITPHLKDLRYYAISDNNYTDRDFYRDLKKITEVLEVYCAKHAPGKHLRLILLLDEMDVLSSYDRLVQQQLRRIFMREFAATLGAVVAGIQINKDWDRVESPWFNLFNDMELAPFTREQAIELLVEPVRGYYQYEPAAIEFIIDHADGRPYKIQQYGLESVNHMLAARRRRIKLADVEAAHRRLEAAERAGKSKGIVPLLPRSLFERLQDVVIGPQASASQSPSASEVGDEAAVERSLMDDKQVQPKNGKPSVQNPKREGS